FEDDVCIRSSHAERTHTRAARFTFTARPFSQLSVHIKRALREVDFRVWLLVIQTRRQFAVLERQHGLDQSRDSGRCIEVTDIALHRSDRTKLSRLRLRAKGLG